MEKRPFFTEHNEQEDEEYGGEGRFDRIVLRLLLELLLVVIPTAEG